METEYGSRSSKHLEGDREHEEDSARSTNPFEAYPKLLVRVESTDNFEMNPEMVSDGSPSSDDCSSEGSHVIVDESISCINDPKLLVRVESTDNFEMNPEMVIGGSPSIGNSSSEGSHVIVDESISCINDPKLLVRAESTDNFEISPEMVIGSPSIGNNSSEGSHVIVDESISYINDPKLLVHAESTDNFEMSPEMVIGSPSIANSSSEGSHVIVDESISCINDHHFAATPSEKIDSPSSSSATSEDLLEVLDAEPDSSPVLLIDTPITTHQDSPAAATSSNSSESEEEGGGFPGMVPLSPAPDVHPRIPPASPTKSPPVQVMDRTDDGYDPYRIPASIFEKSPSATPQDWSVASNESLFSIHIGNSSFSREHTFMLEGLKSGELFSLSPVPQFAAPSPVIRSAVGIIDTSNHHQPIQQEKIAVPPVPPIAEGNEREAMRNPADDDDDEDEDEEEEDIPYATMRVSSMKYSGKLSKLSHSGSGDSVKSFAFPIRKKKCSWPSCYGSKCSRALRYCTCPQCHFRWPRCHISCCSWAFCYSWNCSRKGWYCCSSCNLTDRVRSGSDKTSKEQEHRTANMNIEEENLQPSSTPETPMSPPKKGRRGCFTGFRSWCSCSCPFRFRRCCG